MSNMTTSEFANKIRQRFPDGVTADGTRYADLSDVQLTDRVIKKYPTYKTQISDLGKVEDVVPEVAPAERPTTFEDIIGVSPKAERERIMDAPSDILEAGEGVIERFKGRTQRLGADITRRAEEGFTPAEIASTALGFGGATFATVADIVGEAIIGTAKVALTPTQEEAIGGAVKGVASKFVNTELVRDMVAGWNDFKQRDPETASNIESAADFSTFLVEALGLRGASAATRKTVDVAADVIQKTAEVAEPAVKRVGEAVEEATEVVKRTAAERKVAQERAEALAEKEVVQETIAPGLNAKEVRKAAEEGRIERGKETFFFGQEPDVVRVTDRVEQIADTIVRRIDGASKMDDVQLLRATKQEIETIADNLEPKMREVNLRDVTPTETPIVAVAKRYASEDDFVNAFTRGELDTQTVDTIRTIYGDEIFDNPAQLRDLYRRAQNPSMIDVAFDAWEGLKVRQQASPEFLEFAGSARFQEIFESYLNKLRKGTKEKTLADLWQIRKEYDASIADRIKQANDNSPITSQVQKEMWLENRRILNDLINDSSRGLGDESRRAFSDMSDLYTARENMVSKAKLEKGKPGIIDRTVKGTTQRLIPFGVGALIF